MAKRLAVKIMNPDRIHDDTKRFQLTTKSSQRNGSGDVTGQFVPRLSSSDRKRPITLDGDETRGADK